LLANHQACPARTVAPQAVPAHIAHGTETAYDDYRCRCALSVEMKSIKKVERYRQQKK